MLTIVQCVNNMDLGGVEQLVLTLSRQLRDRGYGSLICCIEDRGTLAEKAEADDITVRALNTAQNGKLTSLRNFCSLLRQSRPVVIHSHNFKPFYYSALATMLGASRGHIHTRHGSLLHHHPALWRYRLLRRWVDTWVTVSADRQAELAQHTGLPLEQIQVLPNGIDTTRFSPATDKMAIRRQLGLPGDVQAIVVAARLVPVKDFRTLLHAFVHVRRAIPDSELWFVGEGPERPALQTLSSELGLASHTRFLGQRSNVEDFLQAADVFALSSLSEGLSVALIEAAACGLPIVATNVGGNPEIVDSTCGILVPPQAPEALSAALLQLLQDQVLRKKFALAARQRAVAHFSLNRMVDSYIALYKNALSGL